MSRGTCVALVLVIAMAVSAEIPTMITYQGRVTDTSGNPVADDTYTMRFRIYNQFIGGTSLWDSGNQNVNVVNGVFGVMLGGTGYPALGLEFDTDYWLQVTFAGVDQTPRQRLTSAGYAFMASGLVPGTEVIGSVTSGTSAAVKGTNTATTGVSYGVYGQSPSIDGTGVYGAATAISGFTYGVVGRTMSTGGFGVYGWASTTSGQTHGVYGLNFSNAGTGVYGDATALSGVTYGVVGEAASPAGRGVYGEATASSGVNYGLYGVSNSNNGTGVYGQVTHTSPSAYAVHGVGPSRGVFGEATATAGQTHGVYGWVVSPGGTGVLGHASNSNSGSLNYGGTFFAAGREGSAGVKGESSATAGLTFGVYGMSTSPEGHGVHGYAPLATGNSVGVYGESASSHGVGVYGTCTGTDDIVLGTSGVYGHVAHPYGRGVCGYASSTGGIGAGVFGSSESDWGFGVYGAAMSETGPTTGGWFDHHSSEGEAVYAGTHSTIGSTTAVYALNRSNAGTAVYGYSSATTDVTYGVYGSVVSSYGVAVYYSGGLAGTGSKSCVVRTSKGPTLFYCQESPENWFEDFGLARLIEGRAHVELDPIYLEAVTIDAANPLLVFTELQGPCNGTYVTPGNTGFDVVELHEGRSNVAFAYRVVAKRKGFEEKRLDVCRAAERDPYLYPELRKDTSADDELMAQRLRHAQATRELAGMHSASH